MDANVPNNHANPKDDDEPHPHIKSQIDQPADDGTPMASMPIVYPEELTGCTFLVPNEGSQVHCAHVVEAIKEHEYAIGTNPDYVKFYCSMNDDHYEEGLLTDPGLY